VSNEPKDNQDGDGKLIRAIWLIIGAFVVYSIIANFGKDIL